MSNALQETLMKVIDQCARQSLAFASVLEAQFFTGVQAERNQMAAVHLRQAIKCLDKESPLLLPVTLAEYLLETADMITEQWAYDDTSKTQQAHFICAAAALRDAVQELNRAQKET